MVKQDLCPWQCGPLLTASLRKLIHDPRHIAEPYLSAGMTAMDIGCGMGFFSIPMSGMTGRQGKVIAIDLQPQMLAGLQKNAQKAGADNIIPHQCDPGSLNIKKWDEAIDFVLIFLMLHEVPDADRLIREVYDAVKPGGRVLFAEPFIHVGKEKFQRSVSMMQQTGFSIIASPKIHFCRSVIFQKVRTSECRRVR